MRRLRSFQFLRDSVRIPAAIEFGTYASHFPFDTVINGIRESPGKEAVVTVVEYSVKEAERAKAELSKTRTIVIQRETELEEERCQKEEAKAREAEAKAREEEERRQKEEAKAQVERAVRTLAEKLGIPADDARKMLES